MKFKLDGQDFIGFIFFRGMKVEDEPDVEKALIQGKIIKRNLLIKKVNVGEFLKQNHGVVFRRLGRRMDVVRNFGGRFSVWK